MARGAISPLIFDNTLVLPYSVAKESAATTLMSTDLDGIASGIPQFHEIWASILEVAIGVYLVATVIDQAAFLVALPIIGKHSAIIYHRDSIHLQMYGLQPLSFLSSILANYTAEVGVPGMSPFSTVFLIRRRFFRK